MYIYAYILQKGVDGARTRVRAFKREKYENNKPRGYNSLLQNDEYKQLCYIHNVKTNFLFIYDIFNEMYKFTQYKF